MFLADYHLHSKFSFDGHHSIESICETGISLGFSELVLTDHMDIYSGKPYDYILDCPAWYKNLQECQEKYRDRISLKAGIELGQPMRNPAEGKRFLTDYPDLDFIIGSVHNMDGDIDVGNYDFSVQRPDDVYRKYLDYLICFAKEYDYDVIGHITYPLRYMAEAGITLNLKPFYPRIKELYEIIIGRGKGIELNVSGYRQAMKTPMPPEELLLLYHNMGGKILTIGSDAHWCQDIGSGIREGKALAKKCGFSYLTRFDHREPFRQEI